MFFFAYFNVLADDISHRLVSAVWNNCLLIIRVIITHKLIDTLEAVKKKCCEKVFFQKVHLKEKLLFASSQFINSMRW